MKIIVISLIFFSTLLSANLNKVTLHLKWKHQFQSAGFYMAKEKGFYNDAGLDVKIKEKDSKYDYIEDILAKENSFGIVDSILIYEKMLGKKLKILGTLFQESPLAFFYLKDSGIKTIKDFKNKRIMLDLSMREDILLRLLLQNNGIEESEISYYPTTYKIDDLIDGKVDIVVGYISNELFSLEKKGIEFDYIKPQDFGIDFYGDILFTSEKNFKNNPKEVEAFYNASIKGWLYAFKNIDETIKLIQKKYNTQKLSYEKLYHEALILKKLSEVEKGNLGKINLTKINVILSRYYLSESGFNLDDLNNLDPYSLINEDIITNDIILTKKEIDYIKNKKIINYCYVDEFAPFVIEKDGRVEGISIDYLNEISKSISLLFKGVKTKNLSECYDLLSNKRVDLTPVTIVNSISNEKFLKTDVYSNGNFAVATRINEPFVDNFSIIGGKTVSVNRAEKTLISIIRKKFPNLKIEYVDDIKAGLELVLQDKVYAHLANSSSLAYYIHEDYPYELKIMNKIGDKLYSVGMGVSNENTLLVSILNKTLKTIPKEVSLKIRNYWIPLRETKIDYSIVWKIMLIFAILFIAFLYRQYVLKKSYYKLERMVQEEVEKNRQKDKFLFQQTKLASMGEMLNNIAHQWRQPLNSINSSVAVIDSKLMKHNIEDKVLDDTLIEIENQTKYMSETIESFRTFFYPSKEKSNFLLTEAIKNVLRIVKYDFERSGIQIKIIKQKDLLVEGFLGEYIQTVISILNNSKDAFIINGIKNPKITIYISKMLIIEDNAGGIDEQIIERIFEPYFTTKLKEKGTGTGLYMAKMIIENSMDGTLGVERINNGTRFKIII